MTYRPIDLELVEDNAFDGQPLPSALGVSLVQNLSGSTANRMKRHSITYGNLGLSGSFDGSNPPDEYGMANLQGFSGSVGMVMQNDPDTIGLTFSTPPNDMITLPPIMWPTSANCNNIKIILNMRAMHANVEVFAFVREAGSIVGGVAPSTAASVRSSGLLEFNSEVQSEDYYVDVGTSTPTESYFTPVELNIAIPSVARNDGGIQRPGEQRGPSQIFICFHSKLGGLDYTGKLESSGGNQLGGSFLTEGTFTWDSIAGPGASTQYNPAGFHRWIKPTSVIDAAAQGEVTIISRPYMHVVQVRPGDFSDPIGTSEKARYVVWPPMEDRPIWAPDTALEVYKIGVAQIASITIQEEQV